MTYGDGSGTNFDVLTSLDSGEMGHAICEKQSNLPKSGAMNEGFSVYGVRVWDILRLYKINMVNREDIERRAGKRHVP
jgi:Zn-dependent metalloprotease